MNRQPKLDYNKAINLFNSIPCGRENAIKRIDLSVKSGLSPRMIRMYNHYLRIQGHLVMSNSKYGIYRASNDKEQAIIEIEEYMKHNQSYIIDLQANITAAKKELDKIYKESQVNL